MCPVTVVTLTPTMMEKVNCLYTNFKINIKQYEHGSKLNLNVDEFYESKCIVLNEM